MNTILELFNIRTQYNRGVQTGLWGLIGIGIVILMVAFWSKVEPVLAFLEVMKLLDKLGIIAHGQAVYMTWYRLFGAIIAAYFVIVIVGVIVLGIIFLIGGLLSSKLGGVFEWAFAWIAFALIFGPILLVIFTFVGIGYILKIPFEIYDFIKSPSTYFPIKKEVKRMRKNSIEIKLVKYLDIKGPPKETREEQHREIYRKAIAEYKGEEYIPPEKPKYKEHNQISYEEAFYRLNRLPTIGDYHFLVGVTYEHEFYCLLPKPLNYEIKSDFQERYISFSAFQLKLGNKMHSGKGITPHYELLIENWTPYITQINHSKFEHFFDVGEAEPFRTVYRSLLMNRQFPSFVEEVQSSYFVRKNQLIQTLMNPEQSDEHYESKKELNRLIVGNDEIVHMIRYGTKDGFGID